MAKDKEPITPYITKIRALAALGVSTVLVVGGSGDYFDVADAVVCMEEFRPRDVTAAARAVATSFGPCPAAAAGVGMPFGTVAQRVPTAIYGALGFRALS